MSQASETIAPAAAEGKTSIGRAMHAAQTKAKPAAKAKPAPQARRIPEGGNVQQPFTLERSALTCPTLDRMSRLASMFGFTVPDIAELQETAEECVGKLGNLLVASLGARGEIGTSMSLQGYVEAFVVRACLACEMADAKASNVRNAVSKFNAERDEDRDGPSGFPSYIENMMDFGAQLALQGFVAHYMAEGAVSAFAHVTGEDWKPRARKAASAPLDERAAAARLAAFE